MAIARIVVDEIVSPGTIRAGGMTYVLRGVPDVEEDIPRFAEARALVAGILKGSELSYDEETARELPELPGTEIDALAPDGTSVTPGLAAKVAGILAGFPLR